MHDITSCGEVRFLHVIVFTFSFNGLDAELSTRWAKCIKTLVECEYACTKLQEGAISNVQMRCRIHIRKAPTIIFHFIRFAMICTQCFSYDTKTNYQLLHV